jgi:hypothetical protein
MKTRSGDALQALANTDPFQVPENVRALNQEKLAGYESELNTTQEALEGLRGMMAK